ncbi:MULTISPECIES: hypothetical protein [Erysipelotrichaceae]|uniref:Conjugal transfer protein TrbL n=1 Tax=Faecalicoccus pleomorphus TaxID=1323 RepID=A0A3E3E655_9FIRM|nr:hypothetical protein [Faecalicoccus pleomorphus]RGD77125.1 hypothetical protein DXC78_04150 [Faecalicoccus pleomorphus]
MDGIIDNLTSALNTWNEKLAEIWMLLTQSPETFKGGDIWNIIVKIHGALQAIGLSLLVLFFLWGLIRTCTNWQDIKRPEHAFKLFLRFIIARGLVMYGMELMTGIFEIVQGVVSTITHTVGLGTAESTVIPQEIIDAVNNTGFLESIPLWAVTLLGSIFITILSFIMILTVYGRFFKIYMYTAISPIPLAAAAGESTQNTAFTFIKSYAGVCLEGAIILLSCVIFSAFASSAPAIDTSASAVSMIWSYIGELIFNMLVLVGTIKMSDRIVKEMMGL